MFRSSASSPLTSFTAIQSKQKAAHDLEEGNGQQVRNDGGEHDAQQDGDAGAEDDAPFAQMRRQRPAGERDDDGIVARQQEGRSR